MRGKDDQRAGADGIAVVAEDRCLVGGETGDALAVLLVLGVAEEDGAGDLVLDGGAGLGEGVSNDGGTLAVLRHRGLVWHLDMG